jgi:quinol monooxygenase YgiN
VIVFYLHHGNPFAELAYIVMKIIALGFLILIAFMNACKTESTKWTNDTVGGYLVIWKYKVKHESANAFEHEYGSGGTWYKLFSKSEKYKGSFLHKSEEEERVYILIDTWTDKKSYEDFKEKNREIYNELSAKFENLYESEERIGSFYKVD